MGGGGSYTVTLRLGQLSPNVPPCSLKVMRFHTAIMVSSGTLKWNSSTLAKDLNALSLRGVRVKYSVTKRPSVGGTHGGGELAKGGGGGELGVHRCEDLSSLSYLVCVAVANNRLPRSVFVLAHGDLCIINMLAAGVL